MIKVNVLLLTFVIVSSCTYSQDISLFECYESDGYLLRFIEVRDDGELLEYSLFYPERSKVKGGESIDSLYNINGNKKEITYLEDVGTYKTIAEESVYPILPLGRYCHSLLTEDSYKFYDSLYYFNQSCEVDSSRNQKKNMLEALFYSKTYLLNNDFFKLKGVYLICFRKVSIWGTLVKNMSDDFLCLNKEEKVSIRRIESFPKLEAIYKIREGSDCFLDLNRVRVKKGKCKKR